MTISESTCNKLIIVGSIKLRNIFGFALAVIFPWLYFAGSTWMNTHRLTMLCETKPLGGLGDEYF